MLTKCSFDEEKNKFKYYRGIDCIKKFCKKLKKRAIKITNYEENMSFKEQETCHICKGKFCMEKDDEN